MNNRIHRTTIAWGDALVALFLLMVTPIFLMVVFIVAASGEAAINETAIVGATILVPVLILFFCALPFIIAAYGLFKGKSRAPGAAIVAAVLNLLNIPLGTALSIYTFVIASQGKLRVPSIQSGNSSLSIKPLSFLYIIGGFLLFGLVGLAGEPNRTPLERIRRAQDEHKNECSASSPLFVSSCHNIRFQFPGW